MISAEWLSGFFDGEGYIGVGFHKNNNGWYQLILSIINTDRFILETIKKDFGGLLHTIGRPYNPKWKICYRLTWHGKEAQGVAKKLLPFSKLKAGQLKLSLEFPTGKTGTTPNQIDKQKREEIYLIMKQMNTRGIIQLNKSLPDIKCPTCQWGLMHKGEKYCQSCNRFIKRVSEKELIRISSQGGKEE
jgi:hypothetical protein